MSEQELSFEAFVAAINLLAVKAEACQPGEDYGEAEIWRDAYADGMTPEEAWDEEVYAASQMFG